MPRLRTEINRCLQPISAGEKERNMNIEELKSTQAELMIQHAEVGCALIGKDLPAEAADWINEGVSIAVKMNDATARQLMTIEK